MRQPQVFKAEVLKDWDVSEYVYKGVGDYWRPARPMGHNLRSWQHRFKTAWLVLIGRYDAVNWG